MFTVRSSSWSHRRTHPPAHCRPPATAMICPSNADTQQPVRNQRPRYRLQINGRESADPGTVTWTAEQREPAVDEGRSKHSPFETLRWCYELKLKIGRYSSTYITTIWSEAWLKPILAIYYWTLTWFYKNKNNKDFMKKLSELNLNTAPNVFSIGSKRSGEFMSS